MRRNFLPFLCLVLASTLQGGRLDKEVRCVYGEPASIAAGVLRYDAFTVRLIRRTEFIQRDGRTSWWVLELEVLNGGKLTIGGDIEFSSEERANARRFDVGGQMYVAEMYSSTAVRANSNDSSTSRLYPGEIIIWDRNSASRNNPRISSIWKNESIDVGTRYSSRNAYENGVRLEGFTPPHEKMDRIARRLERGSLKVIQVPLLKDATSQPDLESHLSEYGVRHRYRGHSLRFPNFDVALVEVWESNPFVPALRQRLYFFHVFGRDNQKVAVISFSSGTMANGKIIEVAGKRYFVEMFFSTGKMSDGDGVGGVPLQEDELIVWDTAAAEEANPQVLLALTETTSGEDRLHTVPFAGGRRLMGAFTGTYFLANDGLVSPEELDEPVMMLSRPRGAYPKEYSGSGLVGNVNGIVYIKEDGSVRAVLVTHGNEMAFQSSSEQALLSARFSVPRKNGNPCMTSLNFSWTIAEPVTALPEFRSKGER